MWLVKCDGFFRANPDYAVEHLILVEHPLLLHEPDTLLGLVPRWQGQLDPPNVFSNLQ